MKFLEDLVFRLLLAFIVVICGTGCEGNYEDWTDIEDETVLKKIKNGDVITGKYGVVEFSYPVTDSEGRVGRSKCTGSMISPRVMLTAAHCFIRLGAGDGVNSGNEDFLIRYHDPEVGLRVVYDGHAAWHGMPKFNPHTDNGATWANNDLAVVLVPTPFEHTDYHDYLRLFFDSDTNLTGKKLDVYGAGMHNYKGSEDDKLRTAKFYVESKGVSHIVIDNDKYCVCKGDSGGPWIYHYDDIPMVAAVASNIEWDDDEGPNCANNDRPNNDAFGSRTSSGHMNWVKLVTRLNCPLIEGESKDYLRCFDVPFIEDVPYEGLYEMDDAVAMTMASMTPLL